MDGADFSSAGEQVTQVYPLPPLITFAGAPVADAVQEILRRRAATNPKRTAPPLMLDTLRGFAFTLQKRGLFDLALISTGDVNAYLSSLSLSTGRSFSSTLRTLFDELVERKLVKRNPFVSRYISHEGIDLARDSLERRAPWALYFARRSSAACEQALVDFLEKHRRRDGTQGYRLAEMENVAKWMVAEGVESWAQVTEQHMGRYRTVCLRDRPKAVRHGYNFFAALFLRHLFRKGLVPAKFKMFFKAYQRVIPPPIYVTNADELLEKFNALKDPPELPKDFTLAKLDELPFDARRLVAKLTTKIEQTFEGPIRSHGRWGDVRREAVMSMRSADVRIGQQIAVIEMNRGEPYLTASFVARYNSPSREMHTWAKDFQPKTQRNSKLAKIAPPLPPKGGRAHKAYKARMAAAATIEDGPRS